jgi:hypothetical protein
VVVELLVLLLPVSLSLLSLLVFSFHRKVLVASDAARTRLSKFQTSHPELPMILTEERLASLETLIIMLTTQFPFSQA